MRLTFSLFALCVLAAIASPAKTNAAELSALLVAASKTPGPSDARLKPYEANLRRILRFESFRLVGEGSTTLSGTGKGQISLGSGHQLQLELAGGKGNRVDVTWQQGNRTLMQSVVPLKSGVPAVLGGPGTGKEGEVYAVIVVSP